MIIFINGSRNAGKTTTASLLASKLPNSAHIDIDTFRGFFPTTHWEETIPWNLELAFLATRYLVATKLHVILNYPLRKQDHYFVRKLRTLKTPVYLFTLKPNLKVALSKRGSRIPTLNDKKRIRAHYNQTSAHYLPELGTVIDNHDKPATEVVKIILDLIKKKS